MRTSHDVRDADQRGLLWLLDEEAIFPGATDDSFMERVLMHHGHGSDRRKCWGAHQATVLEKNVKEKETESNISRILQVVSCHVVYAKSLIYTKLI